MVAEGLCFCHERNYLWLSTNEVWPVSELLLIDIGTLFSQDFIFEIAPFVIVSLARCWQQMHLFGEGGRGCALYSVVDKQVILTIKFDAALATASAV